MNMKLVRQRLCLVVLSSAFGVAGLAQASTVERSQAEAASAVAQPRVLDDALMAHESAGATSSQRAAIQETDNYQNRVAARARIGRR